MEFLLSRASIAVASAFLYQIHAAANAEMRNADRLRAELARKLLLTPKTVSDLLLKPLYAVDKQQKEEKEALPEWLRGTGKCNSSTLLAGRRLQSIQHMERFRGAEAGTVAILRRAFLQIEQESLSDWLSRHENDIGWSLRENRLLRDELIPACELALKCLKQSKDENRHVSNSAVRYLLGVIHSSLGNDADSRKHFEKSVAVMGDSSSHMIGALSRMNLAIADYECFEADQEKQLAALDDEEETERQQMIAIYRQWVSALEKLHGMFREFGGGLNYMPLNRLNRVETASQRLELEQMIAKLEGSQVKRGRERDYVIPALDDLITSHIEAKSSYANNEQRTRYLEFRAALGIRLMSTRELAWLRQQKFFRDWAKDKAIPPYCDIPEIQEIWLCAQTGPVFSI